MIFTVSCKHRQGDKKLNSQDSSVLTNGQTKEKELVPYSDIYHYDQPFDTTLTKGIYLLHLVNRDTTDLTLYLKYGSRHFDSLYVMERGLEMSPCHRYELCYATEKTLAIQYQCMNSRALTLLPLQRSTPVVENLNLLYNGTRHGLMIFLLEDDNIYGNGDSLLVADLDFKRKQYIKINTLVCGDRIKCFADVKIKGDKLYLTYTGAVPNGDPRTIKQVETIQMLGSR